MSFLFPQSIQKQKKKKNKIWIRLLLKSFCFCFQTTFTKIVLFKKQNIKRMHFKKQWRLHESHQLTAEVVFSRIKRTFQSWQQNPQITSLRKQGEHLGTIQYGGQIWVTIKEPERLAVDGSEAQKDISHDWWPVLPSLNRHHGMHGGQSTGTLG